MSTSQPVPNGDQEMDLKDIFTFFTRMFYKVLALFFRAIDFIFKFWWIILILIIGGAALGYFTKNKPSYKSVVIVKSNFNSQAYLYNAIKQFDDNLSEKDSVFIESVGLTIEKTPIKGVKIQPVVDVMGLIDGLKDSDRTLGTIIKELPVDDDGEGLFASDRFYTNYKFHKLIVDLRSEDAKKDIQKILDFINNQPYVKKIKEEQVKNIHERIKQNEAIIIQSDALIENYTKNADLSTQITNERLSYFNNSNDLNVNGILTFKNNIIVTTQNLKNSLVDLSDTIVVVSDLQTTEETSFKDKKEVIYPVVFVFLFLLFAGIKYTYTSLRKAVEEQELLN